LKEDFTLGVRFTDLKKILNRSSNEDVVFGASPEDNKIVFRFLGTPKRTHEIKLVKLLEENDIPPNVFETIERQLDARVELPSSILTPITRDALIYSDAAELSLKHENFMVRASGDSGEYELDIPLTDENKVSIRKVACSSYALNYLSHILKTSKISKSVTLRFSDQKPILLLFNLEENTGRVRFILAPRVEETGEDYEKFEEFVDDSESVQAHTSEPKAEIKSSLNNEKVVRIEETKTSTRADLEKSTNEEFNELDFLLNDIDQVISQES